MPEDPKEQPIDDPGMLIIGSYAPATITDSGKVIIGGYAPATIIESGKVICGSYNLQENNIIWF